MVDVLLEQYDKGQQSFVIRNAKDKLAEMVMDISGNIITVYHTEVFPGAEGKGLGKILLKTMVEYARQNGLKVKPLCVFVQAQFKRHPDLYSDLWQKG
ncbi:MAG: GNAT family N-acetyltransferase [Ferruginibacter sp.]